MARLINIKNRTFEIKRYRILELVITNHRGIKGLNKVMIGVVHPMNGGLLTYSKLGKFLKKCKTVEESIELAITTIHDV